MDPDQGVQVEATGRRQKPEWVPWERFAEPSVLTRLVEENRFTLSDRDRIDRAAFLALVGLAKPLHSARAYLQSIDPRAADAGRSAQPPAVATIALDTARKALAAMTDPTLAAETASVATFVNAETAALTQLRRGLTAFSQGHYSEAALWLGRLRALHRGTLAFAAVVAPEIDLIER
jgi:hypothetical protein